MPGALETLKTATPIEPRDSASWWEYAVASGLFVLAAIAAVGLAVPSGSEEVYLQLLRKFADPSYLAGDWTFGSGFNEFFVWVRVFGPLANLLGVEFLAVAGRIVVWIAISLLFIEIGRRLGARPLFTTIALIAWLGLNQSMGVGATAIITSFQASLVAYPLLLAAMVLAMRGRITWTMLLAGLAFSMHPGVGLWGSGALALTLLILPETRERALRSSWLLILGALPGAVPLALSLMESSVSSEDSAFLTLTRIPRHVDPFMFGERGPALLSIMLLFNLLLHWRMRQEAPHRLLGVFQAVALVPVVLGVVARITNQTWFLMLVPFRVLPVFATAMFLLNLAAVVGRRRWDLLSLKKSETVPDKIRSLAALTAVVGILILWNPVPALVREASRNLDFSPSPKLDVELALDWVASGTPTDAQVLGPPDRKDLFLRSQRAQYVSWEAVVYDRLPEWRRRLESVLPIGFFNEPRRNASDTWTEEFAMLSQERLVSLSPAVDYVVTTATYDLPEVFRSGEWAVYAVTQP